MIRISSFSYRKGGAADDAHFVFDCRKLKNPHFVEALRSLDGRTDRVQDFVKSDLHFDCLYVPARFHALAFEGAHVAFGCFGGKHRSVAMAELLAKELREKGHQVEVSHPELASA
jgi:RNase adapter protein RapZ